ncbi:hypothetical protein [Streptomyces sp. NPDC051577]|uniref:hypothetical protein n=1 Tax=Streptomyces sp. NPDC051577 TaxID=3155166 RepID=UPI003420FF88
MDSLVRALRAEADGKELRKELAKNMRNALRPGAEQAKSAIMGMSSAGPGTSPALRSAIAKKIRPEVKLGGSWSGARVKAFKTRTARGFVNSPKRTNRPRGWRHLVYGRADSWVTQHGPAHWFDHALIYDTARYKRAVHEAMEATAERIANRVN